MPAPSTPGPRDRRPPALPLPRPGTVRRQTSLPRGRRRHRQRRGAPDGGPPGPRCVRLGAGRPRPRRRPARSSRQGQRSARRARPAGCPGTACGPARPDAPDRPTARPRLRRRAVSSPCGQRPGHLGVVEVQAGRRQRQPYVVVGGVRSPEPNSVSDRPGGQVGRLREVGDLRAPRVRVEVGQPNLRTVRSAQQHGTVGRCHEAHEHGEQRGLACPVGSGERGHDAGSHDQVEVLQSRRGPVRVADGQVADDDLGRAQVGDLRRRARHGKRGLEHGEHPLRRPDPLGGRVEVLPHEPDRQVGLGGEEQHGESGGQGHVPRHEPQPDGDGHDRHRERGHELEHQRRQERDAQDPHRGPAVLVTHLGEDRASVPCCDRTP